MLSLMKYEFRKSRSTLFIIGGGLLLLQLWYLFGFFKKDQENMAVSAAFLFLFSLICFFAIFILAINNYYRELNSKSSYLIFMTPNSILAIIFSKMLTILLMGILVAVLFVVLFLLDLRLYYEIMPQAKTFTQLLGEVITDVCESFGIQIHQIFLTAVSGILIFLVSFFSTVSISYLAVTLSLTFLQNSRLRGVLSVLLFLVINYACTRIIDILPKIYEQPANVTESMISVLPAIGFQLVMMIVSIVLCAQLLDKKLSL